MKKLALLSAFLICSGFTGCMTIDRHSVLLPTPAKISPELKQPCARLIDIPDRDLSQEEWNNLVGQMRRSHGACIRKDDKLIKAAEALENQGRKQ
jgi:hypothetical protein